jgi:hypothetical protein
MELDHGVDGVDQLIGPICAEDILDAAEHGEGFHGGESVR